MGGQQATIVCRGEGELYSPSSPSRGELYSPSSSSPSSSSPSPSSPSSSSSSSPSSPSRSSSSSPRSSSSSPSSSPPSSPSSSSAWSPLAVFCFFGSDTESSAGLFWAFSSSAVASSVLVLASVSDMMIQKGFEMCFNNEKYRDSDTSLVSRVKVKNPM